MELEQRIALLKELYAIHEDAVEEAVSDLQTACGPKCATCCTCNVACTTLEGWLVFDALRRRVGIDAIVRMTAAAPASRYRPALTLNHVVALCVQGQEIPEEVNDPGAGACGLLEDQLCAFYDVRPLGCRAMLSTCDCARDGEADMPSFVLSLNNVMAQYLEAVDRPGGWGNLLDVLGFFTDDGRRRDYENRISQCLASPLLANRTFKVLMIPPEHRQRLVPLIEKIQAAIARHT